MAYGARAKQEADKSISTLKKHNARPVHVIDETVFDEPDLTDAQKARWAKTHLDRLSPFKLTGYLDADTIIHADLSAGFGMLADGWEMVMAPSANQGRDVMAHIAEEEREVTVDELGYRPLQLQAGMMFVRKCEAIHALFGAWRKQWRRWQDRDQAALLRALAERPVRLWLLGRPWSDGELVRHLYGRLR